MVHDGAIQRRDICKSDGSTESSASEDGANIRNGVANHAAVVPCMCCGSPLEPCGLKIECPACGYLQCVACDG